MPPARLILLLLLILGAVVLVVVVLRRGSAQHDADRVEAVTARTEAPRRESGAPMGRSDDSAPDVEEPSLPPVDPSAASDPAEVDTRLTRAERRQAREPEPSAPAVGAGALSASARDTRDGEDISHESERIASAADFRDDTPVDPAQEPTQEPTEVFARDAGSETDMDDFSSAETADRSAPADDLVHDADAGAAVVVAADIDRSAAQLAQQSAEERYDPTPTRDWAADEGELLEETHERGERLEAERAELVEQAGDETADATASDDAGDAMAPRGRRISAFEELRDGGFGVGSAAPLDDGAQPLDHPVQAYRDTMTYRVPGDAGYDSAQPHLWFYDEGAAERSGFRRVDG